MSQSPAPTSNNRGLLIRIIRLFFLDPVGESIIDFTELSRGQRILAILGYLFILALLLGVLLIEILYERLTKITFLLPGDEMLVEVPTLAILAACLAFCLGWGFLLTGVTDARKRVFLPIWALFAFQIFLVMPMGSLLGMSLWYLGGPLVLFGLGGIYLLAQRWSGWKALPLLEFCVWLGLFTLFFLGFAFAGGGWPRFAADLSAIFSLLVFFSIPFWLLAGALIVDLMLSLAAKVTIWLRRGVLPNELRMITVALILTRPAVICILLWAITYFAVSEFEFLGEALVVDLVLALGLLLILSIVIIAKRFNHQNAALLLTISLGSPVFALSLVLALVNQELDPLGITLGFLSGIAPILVFVLLLTHSLLSIGTTFANQDGKVIPRSGRILLMFGCALLVIAFTVFFVNLRFVETGLYSSEIQDFSDNLFAIGALLFGLPYLFWTAWKRPTKLTGKASEFTVPSRSPRKKLIWITLLAGLLFTCSVCGLVYWLGQP